MNAQPLHSILGQMSGGQQHMPCTLQNAADTLLCGCACTAHDQPCLFDTLVAHQVVPENSSPEVLMRRAALGWCPPKAEVLAALGLEAASAMACEARG